MPWLLRGSCCFRRFQQPEPGTFSRDTKGKQILPYLHPWHFRSWVLGPQKHLQSASGWGLSARTPGGRDARGGSGGARGSVSLRIRNSPLSGVSIATYTYTWHPATAATPREARPSPELRRACGAAGRRRRRGRGRRGAGAGLARGRGGVRAARLGGVGQPHEARGAGEQDPSPRQPRGQPGGPGACDW